MITKWAQAFNTGDPRKVVALYRPSAVLVPTLSKQIFLSEGEIGPYFVDLLMKKGAKVVVHDYVTRGGIESGFYTFHLADGTKLGARFTFVSRRGKIQTHHSSALP